MEVTAHFPTVLDHRLLLCYAATNNLDVYLLDVANAYLQVHNTRKYAGKLPEKLCKKHQQLEGKILAMDKVVYGMNDANKVFVESSDEKLSLQGFKRCKSGVMKHTTRKDLLTKHMDDMLLAVTDIQVIEAINSVLRLGKSQIIDDKYIKFLGSDLKRDANTFHVSCTSYCEGAANELAATNRKITTKHFDEESNGNTADIRPLLGKLSYLDW